MSSIFSQQKGESKVIQLEKGAEKQDFEVSALRYEANKHFFLSRFFRDQYDAALQNLPVVNSGVVITKIEVWVTNKSSRFDRARNIVAFTGLAENNVGDPSNPMFDAGLFPAVPGQFYPRSVPVSIPARIMKNWKMPVCWILPNIS